MPLFGAEGFGANVSNAITSMIAALLVAVTAQTTALLPPPWQAVPDLKSTEYARYSRLEQDGSNSVLIGTRQVCECQPATAVQMLATQLHNVPGVSEEHDTKAICGQDAQHLVATGIARPDDANRHNLEVFFFRRGTAMYGLEYFFDAPTPMTDAEAALAALCPAS